MLSVQNLQCSYGDILALHDLSFEARAGEIFALIGANGAGKTTTIMALAGHLSPRSGSIHLGGDDVTSIGPRGRLARGVALVPEGRRVFADLSVEDNLTVGGHLQNLGELEANRDNVYTTFPRLAERRSQLAGSLSGGEQQMLAIGRAVMASPTVLLVDELSLGLMPKMVDECYRVIDALKDQGLLIMLVEQSTQRALDVADQVVFMESGRSSWQGSGLEARQNPSIVGAYLGTIEEPEGVQE